MLQVRCAHPTGNFAPKRPFGTFRCCAWLILRFRTDPPSVRRCSARLIRQAETLELQPLRGLHQATLCSFLQNAHASGSLREPYGYRGAEGQPLSPLRRTAPPFAPKCPFGTFRCYGRLISTKSTQYSLLQNARPSGSLRSPYGYTGAKAAHRAALLREKRPRRRLLRGRWRRGIGIFTASGGCRPVRCGRR